MSKKPPVGPEFSKDREFTAVLEDLRSEFRVFGEGLSGLQEKVDKIDERLVNVEEQLVTIKNDVSVIKAVVPTLATKKEIEKLATKKDLEDFAEKFDKRLTVLEAR